MFYLVTGGGYGNYYGGGRIGCDVARIVPRAAKNQNSPPVGGIFGGSRDNAGGVAGKAGAAWLHIRRAKQDAARRSFLCRLSFRVVAVRSRSAHRGSPDAGKACGGSCRSLLRHKNRTPTCTNARRRCFPKKRFSGPRHPPGAGKSCGEGSMQGLPKSRATVRPAFLRQPWCRKVPWRCCWPDWLPVRIPGAHALHRRGPGKSGNRPE